MSLTTPLISDELDDALDLGGDLLGRHEDVRIVLREASHAHEPVQLAALLVAVDKPELAHADGKVLIAVGRKLVDEHAAGAVHGLDGALLPVDLGRIHIILIVIPMPRGLPQRPCHDHGRLHLDIAVAAVDLTPVVNEQVFEHHAVGQEEGEAAALVEEREELEFPAELDVVTLLRLFEHDEVGIHLLLLCKRGAVDAGEHLLLFVAAPVSARNAHQLECLDLARRRKVRPAAEVDERTLLVEGDLLPFGQVVDELHFIVFAEAAHEGDRLVPRQRKALDGKIALDDLLHLRLDLGKIVHRDGRLEVDVIVEPVVDDGPDGELAGRINALDGLRQNVRAGVTVDVQAVLVLERNDLKAVSLFEGRRKIDKLPVHLGGNGSPCEPFRDRSCGSSAVRALRNFQRIPVFENDLHIKPPSYAGNIQFNLSISAIMPDIILCKNKKNALNPSILKRLRTHHLRGSTLIAAVNAAARMQFCFPEKWFRSLRSRTRLAAKGRALCTGSGSTTCLCRDHALPHDLALL